MYTFNITSINGDTSSCVLKEPNISIKNLKNEISKITPHSLSNILIFDNGKKLKNDDIIDYLNKNMYYVIDNKKSFETKEELQNAIKNYKSNDIIKIYGDIENWDVSDITNMSKLFMDNINFN